MNKKSYNNDLFTKNIKIRLHVSLWHYLFSQFSAGFILGVYFIVRLKKSYVKVNVEMTNEFSVIVAIEISYSIGNVWAVESIGTGTSEANKKKE